MTEYTFKADYCDLCNAKELLSDLFEFKGQYLCNRCLTERMDEIEEEVRRQQREMRNVGGRMDG